MLHQVISGVLNAPLNRDDKAAALARFVGWQLRLRGLGPQIAPFVNNTRLRVRKGMTGATGNLYQGLHEFGPMGFALHLLRPGDVFLDVGANVGTYSVLAASVGARAYAFEPGERFSDLEENFALNRIDGRAIRAAVAAEAGTLRFTRDLDSINRPALDGEDALVVQAVTLDDLVPAEIPPPALIKIDVEGYEGAVIDGAHKLLSETPPTAVIMEVGQGSRFGFDDDAISRKMVESYGYAPVTYDPFSRTLKPGVSGDNAVYVRPAAADLLRTAAPFQVFGRTI